MKVKTAEEIFLEEAKLGMVVFNEAAFKKRYKTLFSVIIKSQKRFAEQFIDLAAASKLDHYDYNGNIRSVIKIKDLIK